MKHTSLLFFTLFSLPAFLQAGTTLTRKWYQKAGDPAKPYLASTGNTERGMTYLPGFTIPANGGTVLEDIVVPNRLVVLSRASYEDAPGEGVKANRLVFLNADTGDFLGSRLLTSSSTGDNVTLGALVVNCVAAADDGVLYFANIASTPQTAGSAPFKVYRCTRLPDSQNYGAVTLAFSGNPDSATNLRWGDSFNAIGSGVNTRLVVGSGATAVAVLQTEDGSGFNISRVYTGMLQAAGRGLTFGETFIPVQVTDPPQPANPPDWIWSKGSGANNSIRASTYVYTSNTYSNASNITLTPSGTNSYIALHFDPSTKRLAALESGNNTSETPSTGTTIGPGDRVAILDASTPFTGATLLARSKFFNPLPDPATPETKNANGNSTGAVFLKGNMLYALNTNNGVAAFEVIDTPDIVLPSIATQPVSQTAFAGGIVTFNVSGAGTPPLVYQWQKDGQDIPGKTLNSLTFSPLTAADAGSYTCTVRNASTTVATSNAAVLTVAPSVQTGALTKCWETSAATPGSYMGAGDLERGMDANLAGTEVYLCNRSNIRTIDGATGNSTGTLDSTAILQPNAVDRPGMTFPINAVAVDGEDTVYGASLSAQTGVNLGKDFYIYQWKLSADPLVSRTATVAYSGTPVADPLPADRLGDCMDAIGSGDDIYLIASNRNLNRLVVFSKPAGVSVFQPLVFDFTAASFGLAAGSFGLSVSFAELIVEPATVDAPKKVSAIVYAKGNAPLVKLKLDLMNGSGSILAVYDNVPSSMTGIAAVEQSGVLVGTHVGNSDNARAYRLPYHPDAPGLTLQDQEFYTSNNDNGNNVGSAAIRGNKAFLLATNNSLACYQIALPRLRPVFTEFTAIGNGGLKAKLVANPLEFYRLESSTTLQGPWMPLEGEIGLNGVSATVFPSIDPLKPKLFWRAVLVP
jgi:hypothetical protein